MKAQTKSPGARASTTSTANVDSGAISILNNGLVAESREFPLSVSKFFGPVINVFLRGRATKGIRLKSIKHCSRKSDTRSSPISQYLQDLKVKIIGRHGFKS
ncbi:hypothetical protein [Phyllobacterium sp. 22552]|uniref:hypothetical protein n=1 Tax=Phyllobacterium sp. 22552 TaxID=3453941 RepID=UPI003F8339FE